MVDSDESSTLHIVVTCASRKRYAIPENLRLGHLLETRPGHRFAAWTRRLTTVAPLIPATDLYGGEHWQVARRLPELIGRPANLWICSAGYGLIPATARLNPYAATFAPRDRDSVGDGRADVRDWWRRLTEWPGPAPTHPRSFADLARRDSTASVVVVLSEAYLRACAPDLLQAGDVLHDQDRVAVIGPATGHSDIDEMVVPVTARLRSIVGGSLQALHVRVAAHLLLAATDRGAISRSRLRDAVSAAMDAAAPHLSGRPPGIRLTDADVRTFIHNELAAAPASATALLRRLRQSGRSCEQFRFKHLYTEIAPVVDP